MQYFTICRVEQPVVMWLALRKELIATALFVLSSFTLCATVTSAQDDLPPQFKTLDGRYVRIVTDMPLDDDLRQLPALFDAAVPQWCREFGVGPAKVKDWKVTAYMMRARERFVQAGLLPTHLPQFPYGFQWGDEVWVSEQPTSYYHRHLLLHEGTHWFMSKYFGNNGPPWLMEGLAEWYGTHRWLPDSGELQMGVIPKTNLEVPGWGRITLIQRQLEDGIAPSLELILRYGSKAHQDAEAYAWSWAAVVFLKHHPDSRDVFERLLKQPMRPDMSMTRWLFQRLKQRWPRLRAQWQATLSDLEYGFDLKRRMVELSRSAAPNDTVKLKVAANATWQPTGIYVQRGDRAKISANGRCIVGRSRRDWESGPEGVTIEYYRGRPLGQLVLTTLEPLVKEPDYSVAPVLRAVGRKLDWIATSPGEIMLRINERIGGLDDNSGHLDVSITVDRKKK